MSTEATIQLQEHKTELESPIQDNLIEFLNSNPGIKNINFVYAHPDDIDGYSGGLVSRLATINARRSADTKFNFNFVVVTDGANGTKEEVNRRQLVERRQAEQLGSLQSLFGIQEFPQILAENGKDRAYYKDSNIKVTFLNHPDSNLYEERLVEELTQELYTDGTDLVVTHDSGGWGKPEKFKDTLKSVQNHSDHQTTSIAVSNVLARMEDAGVEVPIMLKAKWGESDLKAEFNPETKRAALQAHESQYNQNKLEMDRIVDEMNDIDGRKFEFFEIANPETRKRFVLKTGLVELAGQNLQNKQITPEVVQQSFESKGIKKILLLNGMSAEPWQLPGVTVERLDITEGFSRDELELYTRLNQIDLFVVPFGLSSRDRMELDRISKFLSSVNHAGFEGINTHKVKGEAIALNNGEGNSLNDFWINIGEW